MANLLRHCCSFRVPSAHLLRVPRFLVPCCFASAETARSFPAEVPQEPVEKLQQRPKTWHSTLTDRVFLPKVAFKDSSRAFTYQDIASLAYANHLKLEEDFRVEKTVKSKRKTLHGKRIAIFTPHDVSFVISLWSTWLSGGIAVPLGIKHPEPQLEYFLKNSDTSVILCSPETQEKAALIGKACGAEILPVSTILPPGQDPNDLREAILPLAPPLEDSALILYTSGTTGQPKGVLWKHDALAGQAQAMIDSWGWSSRDTILHVLPLYHLHGLVNCLITPLSCGASIWMNEEFKAEDVWRHLLSDQKDRINIFMAVPTIYVKLLEHYQAHKAHMPSEEQVKRICLDKMRLMVSGSAPLPDTVFRAWENLTGHALLERYGMTETGMILSNPLNGPRIPGTVGNCLPEVKARIIPAKEPETKAPVSAPPTGKSFLGLKTKPVEQPHTSPVTEPSFPTGELQVSGPNMFSCYWNNEKSTRESFTDDGWFRTGDTAEYQNGSYRLLGRTSTEIIKSGGFKISALDIERRLLENAIVAECAVFGAPDPVWGEKVVSLIKLSSTASPEIRSNAEELQKVMASWVAGALPAYASPREVLVVDEIPRNALGKVNKKEVAKSYLSREK